MGRLRPVLLMFAAFTACIFSTGGGPASKKVTLAGVVWEPSLAGAETRAKSEKKPILLLQMFGGLDDAFC
jgi:hypothetical protein